MVTTQLNLIVGLIIASSPKVTENEREKQLIDTLKKQIEECKLKLATWPPKHKSREIPEEKPVKVEFMAPSANLLFNHIHTTITRITFAPPPVLYDNNGVAIRNTFDCINYFLT